MLRLEEKINGRKLAAPGIPVGLVHASDFVAASATDLTPLVAGQRLGLGYGHRG